VLAMLAPPVKNGRGCAWLRSRRARKRAAHWPRLLLRVVHKWCRDEARPATSTQRARRAASNKRLDLDSPFRTPHLRLILRNTKVPLDTESPIQGSGGSLLEAFMSEAGIPKMFVISPATSDLSAAEAWLRDAGHGATDGVVAKELARAYQPGERAMIKVKQLQTADCVVGGFRYESNSGEVGSLLLRLYDAQGKLDHVGFTATITDEERPSLTKRLEALREAPGFTGKAPGGPSRWRAPNEAGNGSRCGPNSSSRYGSTMSPATAFAMGRS
jgi:hypothetical protein